MARFAPKSAKRSAIPRLMPLEAPAMKTVFFEHIGLENIIHDYLP